MDNPWAISILSGLIVALIAELMLRLLRLFFKKIKTPLELLVSFIRRKECYRRYDNFDKARKYIRRGVKNSKWIKYYSIRGFPLTHEESELSKALMDKKCFNPSSCEEFKVILNDPDGDEAEKRAKEFKEIRKVGEDRYLDQIRHSFNDLLDLQQKKIPCLNIRLHDNPALFRIVIFDKFCLIGFYTDEKTGLNTPAIVFKKKNIFYGIFERHFDQTWERSKERKEKF
jgi:hypothetical protein